MGVKGINSCRGFGYSAISNYTFDIEADFTGS